MKTRIEQIVNFGRDGNAADFYAYGWSVPEDGFTWTDGLAAGLVLPAPKAPHGLYIELFFGVHGPQNGTGSQRLIMSVNGLEVGQSRVKGRMRLAWRVPPLGKMDRRLLIGLALPDAEKPVHEKDPRVLGLAVTSLRIMPLTEPDTDFTPRISAFPVSYDVESASSLTERVTGLTVSQLAMTIESMGVNCEPGFFQRKCGAEPLSLLRFSGVIMHCLVPSLDDGFADIGNTDALDPVPDETDLKDWIIYERRHTLRYHTWVRVPDASIDQMKRREAKRLPFLRNKLLEDLELGEKIFVHQDRRVIADEELVPLALAIRRRGPGRLLSIGPADPAHQAGMVEEIRPGLMRGYFSQFSDALAGKDLSVPEWLAVCMNAWLLARNPPPVGKRI